MTPAFQTPPSPAALVVGNPRYLLRSVVRLLTRAGVRCDCMVGNPRLFGSAMVGRRIPLGPAPGWIDAAIAWVSETGGIVVPCEDRLVRQIRDAPLDDSSKCRLLPVTGPDHLAHVGSKVGLARALAAAGIPSPRFAAVAPGDDLLRACDGIGYPLVVKVDESGGGEWVFRCATRDEALALAARSLRRPLLVQEWIEGDVVDLSGFFQGGRPVHFMHAEFLGTVRGRFGPSKVRRFTHPAGIDRSVFEAVTSVGRVLGLDGFANLTAIRSPHDGRLSWIEADLRPNVWVEATRLLGDDPAVPIGQSLASATGRGWPGPRPARVRPTVDLPYPFRMRTWELLCNRHGVWRTFGEHSPADLVFHASGAPARLLAGVVRGVLERTAPAPSSGRNPRRE